MLTYRNGSFSIQSNEHAVSILAVQEEGTRGMMMMSFCYCTAIDNVYFKVGSS
jgi:hypothetical protein